MEKKNHSLGISIICGFTILAVTIIITSGVLKMKEIDTLQKALSEIDKLQGTLVDYELEVNCNTGFIGVDFQSNFMTEEYEEEYNDTLGHNYNFTRYSSEWVPDRFNLKNIDGLNCNFKVKGMVPLLPLMNINNLIDILESKI